MPDKQTTEKIADLFKAFADPTRVQILSYLVERELCVTDITEAVELSQSAVSHQLMVLSQQLLLWDMIIRQYAYNLNANCNQQMSIMNLRLVC